MREFFTLLHKILSFLKLGLTLCNSLLRDRSGPGASIDINSYQCQLWSTLRRLRTPPYTCTLYNLNICLFCWKIIHDVSCLLCRQIENQYLLNPVILILLLISQLRNQQSYRKFCYFRIFGCQTILLGDYVLKLRRLLISFMEILHISYTQTWMVIFITLKINVF